MSDSGIKPQYLSEATLGALQKRFASLPRPIKLLFDLQTSQQITKTNWRAFQFQEPTTAQLNALKGLGYFEKPASRIDASEILNDIMYLAHYEAGQLQLSIAPLLTSAITAQTFADIDRTTINKTTMARLINACEMLTDAPEPYQLLLTFAPRKKTTLRSPACDELALSYATLNELTEDLTTCRTFLQRREARHRQIR